MGLMINRSDAFVYARWGNDLRVIDYEQFAYDDAVKQTDADIGTEWIGLFDIPTLYASSMKGENDGMPNKWYQLNCYAEDVDVVIQDYLPELFDWIEIPPREEPAQRWLNKCVQTIKWVESPYYDLTKIWKEY